MKIIKIIISTLLLCTSIFAKAQQHKLTITVEGLNSEGTCLIALYNRDNYFGDIDKSFKKVSIKSIDKKCIYTFENLSKGEYAIIAFHDENYNGVLERKFSKIPKEGIGTFKEAKGRPSFQKSKFYLNQDMSIKIEVNYP